MKWIICLIILILSFGKCQAQEANDEAIFQEKLVKWVDSVNAVVDNENNETIKNMDDGLRELRKFAREHPQSKYADDAEFIRFKAIEAPAQTWDEFFSRYPEAKTEDFTKEQLQKLKGSFSAFGYESYIPYELMPLYVRGQQAWLGADYKEAEKYYADFLQKIDLYYADLKHLFENVYISMLNIYKMLNKRKEYDKLKGQVLKLFPEKMDFVERHWPI